MTDDTATTAEIRLIDICAVDEKTPPMKLAKKTSMQIVYEALVGCYNAGQEYVTRETLVDVTGLKKTNVDEQLKTLIDEEMTVIRVKAGFFQPVIVFPETRAISKTVMRGGLVKLEVGSEYLALSPAENRIMKELFGGGNEYHESEAMQMARVLAAQQAVAIKKMNRDIEALRDMVRNLAGDSPQILLALG